MSLKLVSQLVFFVIVTSFLKCDAAEKKDSIAGPRRIFCNWFYFLFF
jgi:hypothetical protein